MKAMAKLKNLKCNEDRHIIVRNLSRIMNVRILDIDVERRTIDFLYSTSPVFEQARRELSRIGYPVRSCELYGFNQSTRERDLERA